MAAQSEQSVDAPAVVDQILSLAMDRRASDVHIEPTAAGYQVRCRIDGLLETVGNYGPTDGRSLVNRLMVMARLLTYRQDIPQEGRLTANLPNAAAGTVAEMRLAIIPTTHGLRAAVRLPADLIQPRTLEELGLPPTVMDGLAAFVRTDAGMLAVTGPAGSGKTTTIYAVLSRIAEVCPGLSIIALEDPVERHLTGVTQIEVSPFGELTYEKALRSILRQDPQVLMLGEIRDGATASLAIQAALSGHRLVCTLHAATPAAALARLLEMGLEPYQITSAIYGIVNQRLVRKRHGEQGYQGRVPVAEMVRMDTQVRHAVLQHADADLISESYQRQAGYVSIASAGQSLVDNGLTDTAELQRVLGDK